jgi:flagellar biogenesis protein FliO
MLWNWARFRRTAQSNAEKLAVTSSVSLGEKRFVAVIQFGELQYLVGGGATNVALLAQLNPNESFGGMLKDSMTARKKSPAKRMKKKTTKPATKQSENAA